MKKQTSRSKTHAHNIYFPEWDRLKNLAEKLISPSGAKLSPSGLLRRLFREFESNSSKK